jgi:hypothetical protein
MFHLKCLTYIDCWLSERRSMNTKCPSLHSFREQSELSTPKTAWNYFFVRTSDEPPSQQYKERNIYWAILITFVSYTNLMYAFCQYTTLWHNLKSLKRRDRRTAMSEMDAGPVTRADRTTRKELEIFLALVFLFESREILRG